MKQHRKKGESKKFKNRTTHAHCTFSSHTHTQLHEITVTITSLARNTKQCSNYWEGPGLLCFAAAPPP